MKSLAIQIQELSRTPIKDKIKARLKDFESFSDELNMSMAELDLYMWYLKTGEVLK